VLPGPRHLLRRDGALDLLLDNRVRDAQAFDPFPGDRPVHANGEAGSGEGLTVRFWDLEVARDGPHFVLVQVPERFDQREAHVLGDPADVVMGLDRIPERPAALDPIGGDRPLHEPVAPELVRLGLEDPNERRADPPPLLLRVADPRQGLEEPVGRRHQRVGKMARGKESPHQSHLAGAQEARVDEDRLRPVSQGPVREQSGDRRVDAARSGHNRPARDLRLQATGRLHHKGRGVRHAELPGVAGGSSRHLARYCSSARSSSGYFSARMAVASRAAFSAASTPTDATGIPAGICTTERRLSRPRPRFSGTPITGFNVRAATTPGRAAERPAIAMKTSVAGSRTSRSTLSGWRCAEATWTSHGTWNSV